MTSSIDFCVDLDCIKKSLSDVEDLEKPHLPTHRVLLLRKEMLLRNQVKEMNQAKDAITRGERLYKKLSNREDSSDDDSSSEGTDDSSSEGTDNESSSATSQEQQDSLQVSESDDQTEDNSESSTVNEAEDDVEEKVDNNDPALEPEEEKLDKGDAASETGESGKELKEGVKCGVCDESLERPCWYCVECTGMCFHALLLGF